MNARIVSSKEIVRVRIYTRVSTTTGLDQKFNSLDARMRLPVPLPKARLMPAGKTRYDDDGISGATDRPELEDIRAPQGRCHCGLQGSPSVVSSSCIVVTTHNEKPTREQQLGLPI